MFIIMLRPVLIFTSYSDEDPIYASWQVAERVVLSQKAYILFYIQREAASARLPAFLAPPPVSAAAMPPAANSNALKSATASVIDVPPTAASRSMAALSASKKGPVSVLGLAPAADSTMNGFLGIGKGAVPNGVAVKRKQLETNRQRSAAAGAQPCGGDAAAMSGQALSPAQPGEGAACGQYMHTLN